MSEPSREVVELEHDHVFLTSQSRCLRCGMHIEEVRRQQEHRMLTEAFDRLAAVLEKLEVRLTPVEWVCEHEWVDARNEAVESGEMCVKCHAIRATP